jgi:hypothetical protein
MTKLSFFLVSMRPVVAVGMAVGAGAAIIPYGSASAAPDGDAPASEASIPRGTTISYDGDNGVVRISIPFNRGIAGVDYSGFGGDGQSRLLAIPLEPSDSGHGSPDDSLTSLVGIDWLRDW